MARIAKSLDVLRSQINAMAPARKKTSDGWIGDARHSASKSDHNPNSAGVVTALDITHDPAHGVDAAAIAETLRQSKDKRIKYVISNARIFSSVQSPWVWRPYSGANAHALHVHVSVNASPALYDDTRLWVLPGAPVPVAPVSGAFERVHAVIAKWEGEAYTNHPRDKGGPTKYGVTGARLSEARGRLVTAADVRNLGKDEAWAIFRRWYWTPLRADELPLPLALMTYNAGVNSGPAKGATFLQRVLKVEEDGQIGDQTLAAARMADQAKAVAAYADIYEAYYRAHADFDVFGKGWLNRLVDVEMTALAWVAQRPVVQPPPVVVATPATSPATTWWQRLAQRIGLG